MATSPIATSRCSRALATRSIAFGLACGLAGCGGAPSPTLASLHFSSTGYYHLDQDGRGVDWLVDPTGEPFFSTGVSVVTFAGDFSPALDTSPYHDQALAKYGSEAAWAQATSARLAAWNVNTIGAWSDDDVAGPASGSSASFAYTPIVNCANADWQQGTIPDYFSAAFQATAGVQADAATRGRTTDPRLLGYFLDNELQWGEDPRNEKPLLDQYMALPATAEGKGALVALMQSRYPDVATFNGVWGTQLGRFSDLAMLASLPPPVDKARAAADRSAFLSAAAHVYFQVCTSALRSRDANHLLLGVRFFAVVTHPEVLAEAAATQDVISVNLYQFADFFYQVAKGFGQDELPGDEWLDPFYALAQKPYLLSEWSYLAKDSGLPNTKEGIYTVVDTQADKSAAIAAYAQRAAQTPYVVGYHYFQYFDQPAQGRFDGENNDFGLVAIDDTPWPQVVSAFQRANAAAAETHFTATASQ